MQDKRIKQITTEMFIAWGMICVGFLIYNGWIISSANNYDPSYRSFQIAHFIITWSCVPALLFCLEILWFPFRALNTYLPGFVFYILLIMTQFAFYWYLGNLTGRFIVRIKQYIKRRANFKTISRYF